MGIAEDSRRKTLRFELSLKGLFNAMNLPPEACPCISDTPLYTIIYKPIDVKCFRVYIKRVLDVCKLSKYDVTQVYFETSGIPAHQTWNEIFAELAKWKPGDNELAKCFALALTLPNRSSWVIWVVVLDVNKASFWYEKNNFNSIIFFFNERKKKNDSRF